MALCTDQRSTNQTLESMKWFFGKRQCRKVSLTETDLDQGSYFDLNVINFDYTEKKYIVFLDDGVISAPTLPTETELISVSVSDGDTANDKALAIEVALASVLVRTEVVNGDIEIQNALVGAITLEVNTGAPELTFELSATGFGGYIGQTGESELTTTIDLVQLMDDAQGTVVQDEIITGYGAEITIPVKEMTTKRWQDLIGSVSGNNITIDGEEITGWGTEKLYKSMFLYAGRLVGHPVRLDDTDISEDITMLNTAPKMNKINFSGQAIQEAEFLFTSYKDANADKKINLVARGNHAKF